MERVIQDHSGQTILILPARVKIIARARELAPWRSSPSASCFLAFIFLLLIQTFKRPITIVSGWRFASLNFPARGRFVRLSLCFVVVVRLGVRLVVRARAPLEAVRPPAPHCFLLAFRSQPLHSTDTDRSTFAKTIFQFNNWSGGYVGSYVFVDGGCCFNPSSLR